MAVTARRLRHHSTMDSGVALSEFNSRAEDFNAALQACCDAPSWVHAILDGRPYDSRDALLRTAAEAARRLPDVEIDRALAAHPRIGDHAAGGRRQDSWSRLEQSSVGRDEATLDALARANHEYEQRFDQVFLICVTGLCAREILDALRSRLANDDETERHVLVDELGKIAAVRLGRLVTES